MVELFKLEPEVAGGWGPDTVVTNRSALESGAARIPEVAYLEYVFDGWMGDDLLETHPCFIATDRLAEAVRRANLSGVEFVPVKVSVSELFRDAHPNLDLPPFHRLLPQGTVHINERDEVLSWSGHDVCVTDSGRLVVTERCMELLRQFNIDHCDVQGLVGDASV